jgi:hypothetical protein
MVRCRIALGECRAPQRDRVVSWVLRFAFWVLGETLKAVRDWIMPLRHLKTQNPKLNLPPDADNKECRNPAFREQSRRFRTRIRTPENRHPRHILG